MTQKVLAIADSHLSPIHQDLNTWYNLAKYVIRTKPDTIIHLGDVADFDSLCWLKKQRGSFTTEQEIECVERHLDAFEDVLQEYRNKCRQQKVAMYRPQKILCLGNHDVREGFTGVDEIFTERNWDVFDYGVAVNIGGVYFSHCMAKGLSQNACSTAEEILENWHGNIVVGHGHKCDYAETYSLDNNKILKAIKCPVFSNRKGLGLWAGQSRVKWSTGITEIEIDPAEGIETFVWRPMSCLTEI